MAQLLIDGLAVEVTRKRVRYLRLSVHMPDGQVRLSVPWGTPEAAIRTMVAARLAWIHKQQAIFRARVPALVLAYAAGETHYYQGRPYELRLPAHAGRPRVVLAEAGFLDLYAPAEATPAQRAQVLAAWYRAQLKAQVPALLAKWEPVVGAQANAWGIKQMRTRWGTCSIRAKRIWLNLELIKRPLPCLEYVVVHELVHLHERLHNARFWGLVGQAMPDWQARQRELNQGAPTPLPGHEVD
ncbi:DUF45 domain-containing protein [Hymenobacter sp. HMF4947]|uniref:DUF45 domain-containing protein n=1 Tax=Hymenobacter ginkgonis TaxID=2682976 RepID=A0A7K1TGB3_9BACT|nr:SprT family zinc-dependent metalloprotease [Hymenobacter ginkgonis]MVN77443.1 DUF45 domain-containing protein [Hymenobacter ginkgonis]